MKSILTAAFLTAALVPCALSQTTGTPDPDPLGGHPDLPRMIRIQVEFIEMPHEKLTELLEPARRGADDTDLRNKIRDLVKQDEARVLDTAVLTTRSGQRAKVESIKEIIYPTEFDPPKKSENSDKANRKSTVTPPTPIAFETRNVGTTFEIDPVIGPSGAIVDLNMAPEIVYHVGESVFAEWKTRDAEAVISQPQFYTMKVTTAVTLQAGRCHLAAAVTPKDDKGDPDQSRKVLVFVKADILSIGK